MAQRVKPPVNMVHQDAIHCETVKKELKSAVIYQDFTINPHSLKKNSTYDLFKIVFNITQHDFILTKKRCQ